MSTIQPQTYTIALQEALHYSRQAAGIYQQAADLMTTAGWQVIAHAFRFTAAQEREHAAVLQGLLQTCGVTPESPPSTDVSLPREPEALLQHALERECACAEDLLPAAAREAAGADQPRIAEALGRIAETELQHAQRFRQYLTALQDGTLLRSAERTSWLCLPCGSLHFGCDAPSACDGCGGGPGHFIRTDFHPFAVRR